MFMMIVNYRHILAGLCIAFFFVVFTAVASATIYVPDDYAKIQWAVDNATEGGVIIVRDGTYTENIKLKKRLTIRSENGSESTTVSAEDSSAFDVTADYVNISGFAVEGATGILKAGIYLNASYCSIYNNNCSNSFFGIFLSYSNNNSISNNNCSNRFNGFRLEYSNNNTILNNDCITDGIRLKNSSYNVISHNNCWISLSDSSNNFISNNNCTNNGQGMFLEYSSNNTLSDNNCSANGVGIDLSYSNNNSISNNNCSSNNRCEGINLLNSNNNTISNNDCSNNGMESGGWGIALWASSNNFITNNKISFNGWNGILLTSAANLPDSSNNKIVRNNISNNGRLWEPPLAYGLAAGISLTGTNNSIINNTFINDGLYVPSYSTQKEVRGNTVNGKPLVYLENESEREIKGAGQVILLHCNNITVEKSYLSHTLIGIHLLKTNNSKITENNISSNYIHGICLDDSSNNTVCNNNINSNNRHGIYLWLLSNNNTINENIIKLNSVDGIHLAFSSNNTICNNNILNNWEYGIYLVVHSTLNRIYLNNFMNNSNNVYSSAKNIWNSLEKITYIYNGSTYENYLGNYWSDYNGTDVDKDGIGDTHYSIDSDNDTYPLMKPGENYFAPKENIFDAGSPANPYPSISGNHNGTITPNQTITMQKLYTYPCSCTGGHTEYAEIRNTTWNATATWKGYVGDWHNITFDKTVVLMASEIYNYTIRTGSYPQIHHTSALPIKNGWINCTEFIDANGKSYNDWIPAIRLE